MKVEVVCFGVMREHLPPGAVGNRAKVSLPEGSATVADLVDALGAPRRLAFSILLNEQRVDLDQGLHEGDTVTLMPPFTGGDRGAEEHGASQDEDQLDSSPGKSAP